MKGIWNIPVDTKYLSYLDWDGEWLRELYGGRKVHWEASKRFYQLAIL